MFIIHDELHNRYVYVCTCESHLKEFIENYAERDWYDWLDNNTEESATAESINHRCSWVDEVFIPERQYKDVIIYLNFPKYIRMKFTRMDIIRTIVHECVHASDAILYGVGIDISKDNEEARAYQTDWLVGKILPWCEKKYKNAILGNKHRSSKRASVS